MTSRLTVRDNSFKLAALDRRSEEGCGVSIDHGNTGERDCQTRRFLLRKNEKASRGCCWPDVSPGEAIVSWSSLRVTFDQSFEGAGCWMPRNPMVRIKLRSALDGQWYVEPSYDGGRRRTWRWRWGICRRSRRGRRMGCCWRQCWRIGGRGRGCGRARWRVSRSGRARWGVSRRRGGGGRDHRVTRDARIDQVDPFVAVVGAIFVARSPA